MASAAGLGKLNVISGLGEPLSAEIEILWTTNEDLSSLASLSAAIASEEAYKAQGIERLAVHSAIKVEVTKRPDGLPVLKLTTHQPINDPFLDMLIQVDWSNGRLLREYTALLDPPGFGDQSAATVTAPKIPSPSESTTTAPSTAPSKSPAKKKPKSSSTSSATPAITNEAAAEPGPSSPPAEGYTTKRGDTLRSIARELQVEDVSLEQMLDGLFRANKEAFMKDNMNRLKVGKIMRVPAKEELQSVTQQDALQEIRMHSKDWNVYRNKLAGAVAESALSTEEAASNRSSAGKISAPVEDKAAPLSSGPRDVVKLSKSESPSKSAGTSEKDMQAKLNAMQEELTAREKGLKEANERTAMLEKQVQDMQKLLSIKSQAMTDLQKGATAPPAPVTVPAKPEQKAPEQAADQDKSTKTEPVAAQKQLDTNKPDAKQTKKKIVAPPVQKEEPGLLDGLLDNPLVLGAGGAALFAGIGGWLFMRNRRSKGLDSFEQGILTSDGLNANTVFRNTASDTVDSGDTSFLTDFSQSAGGVPAIDVPQYEEAAPVMEMGVEESSAIAETSENADNSMDMPEFEAPKVVSKEAETTPAPEVAAEDTEISFDLPDFELPSTPAELSVPAEVSITASTEVPELDLSGISLDINTPASAVTEQTEAESAESASVNTKLDLATAYSDMGDKEGVRELLEEVLKEGGPQQRERAQQMLNSLG